MNPHIDRVVYADASTAVMIKATNRATLLALLADPQTAVGCISRATLTIFQDAVALHLPGIPPIGVKQGTRAATTTLFLGEG